MAWQGSRHQAFSLVRSNHCINNAHSLLRKSCRRGPDTIPVPGLAPATTLGTSKGHARCKQRRHLALNLVPGANYEKVCVYSDIRYASPPTGKLRFQAPEYPPKSNPSIPGPNPSCYQARDVKCAPGLPFGDIPGDAPSCFPKYYGTQSEDCLFLDVYVPKQVFEKNQLVPVVVWFYGGAYLFGSKTQYDPSELPFYDGSGPVGTATTINKDKNSVIFIRGSVQELAHD